jgi:hypothetical protein
MPLGIDPTETVATPVPHEFIPLGAGRTTFETATAAKGDGGRVFAGIIGRRRQGFLR